VENIDICYLHHLGMFYCNLLTSFACFLMFLYVFFNFLTWISAILPILSSTISIFSYKGLKSYKKLSWTSQKYSLFPYSSLSKHSYSWWFALKSDSFSFFESYIDRSAPSIILSSNYSLYIASPVLLKEEEPLRVFRASYISTLSLIACFDDGYSRYLCN
jgi:hypothetical protein